MSEKSLESTLEMLQRGKSSKPGRHTKKSTNPFVRAPSPPKVTLSSIIKEKKKRKQISKKIQSSQPKTSATFSKKPEKNLSKTEENIKKLLRLSSPINLDSETTQKLIKRAQTQKYVIPEMKPKVDEATVFTDEDFQKFEKEYFCN